MILPLFINNWWFGLIVWVIIFILALFIEISTPQLVSIWFSVAALVALILSVCGVPFVWQALTWVLASLVLIILFRAIFGKKLSNKSQRTNYDALIGEPILITKDVDHYNLGEGKIRDVVWSIKSNDEIKQGEYAKIIQIEGNKLIVEKENK